MRAPNAIYHDLGNDGSQLGGLQFGSGSVLDLNRWFFGFENRGLNRNRIFKGFVVSGFDGFRPFRF